MNRPRKTTGWCAEATTPARKARWISVTSTGTGVSARGRTDSLSAGRLAGACRWRCSSTVTTVALISTAMADFQPKWASMWALSHCQVPATISTGGAAKDVSVPPIDTFTKSTPSAPYFSRSDMAGVNTRGASISAASVMAAGSVMAEPTSGTSARQIQTCAVAVLPGSTRATRADSATTADWMPSSTGREAATTMMVKTNSGSV